MCCRRVSTPETSKILQFFRVARNSLCLRGETANGWNLTSFRALSLTVPSPYLAAASTSSLASSSFLMPAKHVLTPCLQRAFHGICGRCPYPASCSTDRGVQAFFLQTASCYRITCMTLTWNMSHLRSTDGLVQFSPSTSLDSCCLQSPWWWRRQGKQSTHISVAAATSTATTTTTVLLLLLPLPQLLPRPLPLPLPRRRLLFLLLLLLLLLRLTLPLPLVLLLLLLLLQEV